MSVKLMGEAFDLHIGPPALKLVLLAYADHADHDGENVFPSIALIAAKCSMSERSVQRLTNLLVSLGLLIPRGKSKYGTNIYAIRLGGEKISVEKPGKTGRPRKKSGDIIGATFQKVVTNEAKSGDKSEKVVTNEAKSGDTAVSPEPSVKPSETEPSVLRHEQKIEEYKQRIAEAMRRGAEKNGNLKDEMKQLFRVTPNWDTREARAFYDWYLNERDAGQTLATFARWWYSNDWRGKQGQPPTLGQIRELWLQAFLPADGYYKRPSADEIEAMRQRLKEKIQEAQKKKELNDFLDGELRHKMQF